MDKEQIACVAYETNRAYCQSIGDNSQPVWRNAADWQRQSVLNGVEFHLSSHARGVTPSPSDSHNNWLEEKRLAGWKYGPVRNPGKNEHPCLVPFEQLPFEQRLKDYLFTSIVRAFVELVE